MFLSKRLFFLYKICCYSPHWSGAVTVDSVHANVFIHNLPSTINFYPLCTGGGRFMSVRGAYSGCSRARFNSHQVPSREQLDEQLDEYMSMSKSHLDAELDAYMAQVDLEDVVWWPETKVKLHCIFFSFTLTNGACNLTCR